MHDHMYVIHDTHPCSLSSSKCKPASSLPLVMRALNDSKGRNISPDSVVERSNADELVAGMDFGELCNDFECVSSPAIESTARQLMRDILELREGNRALGTFAISVIYKTVQEMVMLSTSVLNIKWTVKGKPKFLAISGIGGDLVVRANSRFTLNQISGQVIEHNELWDLSASSAIGQAYFWTSHQLFAAIEFGKDISDSVKDAMARFSSRTESPDIYPDPSGDPTKVAKVVESGGPSISLKHKLEFGVWATP